MSFFDLVFRRLPSGLAGRDPHAGGTLWGAGLPAVLLLRRPAETRCARCALVLFGFSGFFFWVFGFAGLRDFRHKHGVR